MTKSRKKLALLSAQPKLNPIIKIKSNPKKNIFQRNCILEENILTTKKIREQIYPVESLLDVKYSLIHKSNIYLVRWKGYQPKDDTWEPECNISPKLIELFNNGLK